MKSRKTMVIALFLSLLLVIQPKTTSAQEDIENIRVFDNPLPQLETAVAVNPLDPNNIVVGAIDFRLYDYSDEDKAALGYPNTKCWTGYYWSMDGGATWEDGLIPRTEEMKNQSCDPYLAFDNYGNVYYVGLTYEQVVGSAIFVSKSTDGGETFSDPAIISARSYPDEVDKPAIAVDTTGGEYDGNIYVTWTDIDVEWQADTIGRIMLSKSTDGGNSFSEPQVVGEDPGDLGYSQGSAVAVGLYGDVYVAYGHIVWDHPSSSWKQEAIHLAVGFAGGDQFIWFGSVASVTPIPDPLPNTRQRTNSFPTIDVDRTSPLYPSNGDTVYIAWADNRYGDADILMVGVVIIRDLPPFPNIEGPYMVNDDKDPGESNGIDQFFPSLSVSSTGKIEIAFYDRRDDENNLLVGVYYSQGTWDWKGKPQEATFTENMAVATELTNYDVWGGYDMGLGDYIDIVSVGGNVFVVWTDGRDGVALPEADLNGEVYIAIFPDGSKRWRGFILYLAYIEYWLLPERPYRHERPLDVIPIGNFSDFVYLNVTGVPPGMTIDFDPWSGIPPFTSTMRIDAQIADVGTSIINIFAIGTWPTHERIASFSVEVLPGPFINLAAKYGDPGDVMTILGQGFTPLSPINIEFDGILITTITSDNQGSISGSFTVPQTEGSIYVVTAIDPSGMNASTSIGVPISIIGSEVEIPPPPHSLVPEFGVHAVVFISVVIVSVALIIYMLIKRRKIKRGTSAEAHRGPSS